MEILDLVVTITEAQERWYFSESTVRRWIETEKIRARKSGSTWLIEVPSLLLFMANREAVEFRHPC